jgi:triosephosphate isomerase
MRTPQKFVAGNWKMNTDAGEAERLARAVEDGFGMEHGVRIGIYPPFFDGNSAHALTIQYGGSVKPGNAAAFLSQTGVDGVLIGGASLHADEFLAIVRAGICQPHTEGESR